MTTSTITPTMAPAMQALKDRLKETWMAGDYSHFATYLEPGAMAFLERLNPQPGTRMLDVGCGAGQIAIPAARKGVRVTGVDIASNSIEKARDRAKTEGLDIRFELDTTRHLYPMRYPFSPAEVVEFFRIYYGPTNRAFAALDTPGQDALRLDLEELWSGNNQAQDGSTHVEAEYLEVVALRG